MIETQHFYIQYLLVGDIIRNTGGSRFRDECCATPLRRLGPLLSGHLVDHLSVFTAAGGSVTDNG